MKFAMLLFAFAGIARQCSKMNPYTMLDNNPHPDYVHQMELTLADDLNSDDSTIAADAALFKTEFEHEFKSYQPDRITLNKLAAYAKETEVKTVGGNWCSDTRMQIPRLCKVLYYMQVPANRFMYYRVDHDKKPVENDFAATISISSVPDMVIFYKGKIAGHIIETPTVSIEKDLLKLLSEAD